jgi:hypothetical protein
MIVIILSGSVGSVSSGGGGHLSIHLVSFLSSAARGFGFGCWFSVALAAYL